MSYTFFSLHTEKIRDDLAYCCVNWINKWQALAGHWVYNIVKCHLPPRCSAPRLPFPLKIKCPFVASPPFPFDLTHASMFVFWKLPRCCTRLIPIHPLIIHRTKKSFTVRLKQLIQGCSDPPCSVSRWRKCPGGQFVGIPSNNCSTQSEQVVANILLLMVLLGRRSV